MRFTKYFVSALLILFASAASAAPISFIIGDHTDGSLYDGSTNPYGLRFDDTDQTFTVGDNLTGTYAGGPVTLTFDPMDLAAGAVISGSLVDNSTGSVWELNYALSDLASADDGGFIAVIGSGMLTEVGGSGSIVLVGVASDGRVFEFDNDGHRLDGDPGVGWVGRGWFEGNGNNDFLITGTPVPLPAAIWMFGAAFAALAGMRRRTI